MVKQTWNVDRQKGGSYEFSLDASGNYVLNSVGFNQVKTLNLPELKKDTTTAATTIQDTKAASAQTKEAFGDVQPFYYDKKGGGDQYTSKYQMKKEGDLATNQAMTKGDNFAQARQAMTSDAAHLGVTPSDTRGTPVSAVDKARVTAGDFISKVNNPKSMEYGMQLSSDMMGTSTNKVDQQQKDLNRFPGMVGPQKPSPYQDAIMRGERGVKYEKPEVPQKITKLKKTALKQVKSASNVLSKAVGAIMDNTLVGTVLGSFKETPTNKHDKAYFNVNENGRIAGNASTDLFAGMNRVSARGNLSQAGLNRISKRNSAKTQANLSKLSPERKAAFNAKTKEMEKQHNDYEQSRGATATKSAKAKGLDVKNPNEMRSAGGGSGGGGKTRVICTELHSTGEMSTRDWLRDIKFTYKDLSKEHIKGYLLWAVPTVEHIQKYPRYRKIWKHIAQHRANDIAWRLNQGKFDLLGRIYAGIGEPLCWLIGKCISDRQIKELELNNWRKT